MPPVTRHQSGHSVIDLTEDLDDLAPHSPPRPTIANRAMAPRRRNRDGSASTSTGTSGSRSGSVRPRTRISRAAANGNGSLDTVDTSLTRPTPIRAGSSSDSSIVVLDDLPDDLDRGDVKRRRLDKGKARATSADLGVMDGIEFGAGVILDDMLEDDDENAGGGTEHDGAVNGIPEEELLASFQCPICLAPPIQAILTPCGHVTCGACLFSTLKTQALRERRPPNAAGLLPTTGPGMKKPRGKADQEAWFAKYGADKAGKIKGKILTGSCPVCRHDIEGGFGQPGEGGVIYLEVCTVSSVL